MPRGYGTIDAVAAVEAARAFGLAGAKVRMEDGKRTFNVTVSAAGVSTVTVALPPVLR